MLKPHQARRADPSTAHLQRFVAHPAGAYGVLPFLAGHHQARPQAPLRVVFVATARPHVFPSPTDVPVLLDALFERVEGMFSASASLQDDLLIVAFAAYGVLAVHPFENANGRTAVDFAQILLMHRYGLSAPMLRLPADSQRWFAPSFMAFEIPCKTPEDMPQCARRLAARFVSTRLEDLPSTPLARIANAFSSVMEAP